MSSSAPTEYERYLRVPELLALQKPPEARTHDDELLFQVVHQVEELWMKLALDDARRAVGAMERDDDHLAVHLLGRIRDVEALMTAQLGVLERMPPVHYFHIRKGLGHGSGQESPGFKAMLRMFDPIGRAFASLLGRRRIALDELHRDPGRDRGAFAVAEALVEIDEGFQAFRYKHLQLVLRIIGRGTPSLKGRPTELLERSMRAPFFPDLWAVRETLFREFEPGELRP